MPEQTEWWRDCVTPGTLALLERLRDQPLLSDFYLAGGTGLALQFGHRTSEDLDFFNTRRFPEDSLLQVAQKLDGFELVGKDSATLHAQIAGVKVSFIGYAYPVLFPFRMFLDVRVADPRDIACMKISAIAGRGSRRDFIDLSGKTRTTDRGGWVFRAQRRTPPRPVRSTWQRGNTGCHRCSICFTRSFGRRTTARSTC